LILNNHYYIEPVDNFLVAGYLIHSLFPSYPSLAISPFHTFVNMAATTPNGIGPYPQHKQLDAVVRTPGRQPSPQPTLLGSPGTNHSNSSRILHEQGPGYVAPKFEGKEQQKEDGEHSTLRELCEYAN
jgi:hypothetical protein